MCRRVDHARARWEQCLPIMDRLYIWLAQQKPKHPPKSVMGNAINYTLKNWQALTRFITNTAIPPDNNRSEGALRVVALGRKNFLFAGNKDTGENLAAIYTIVATCVANEVDPLALLNGRAHAPRFDARRSNRPDIAAKLGRREAVGQAKHVPHYVLGQCRLGEFKGGSLGRALPRGVRSELVRRRHCHLERQRSTSHPPGAGPHSRGRRQLALCWQ
jgi:Transposase IS66 family